MYVGSSCVSYENTKRAKRTPARIYLCRPSVGTDDIMDEYVYIERQYQGELHKYLSKGLKLS